MPLWLTALATLSLVILAAKAHGRQVRLEREQRGVFHVDFRRGNPSAVEDLWRRDRLTFWPAFAGLALAGGGYVVASSPSNVAGLALTAAWAFAEAFVIAGLLSWVRLSTRREGALPWRRRAQWGSAAWWAAVVAVSWIVAFSVVN